MLLATAGSTENRAMKGLMKLKIRTMALLELSTRRSTRFEKPRPSKRTAQHWCVSGAVPAKKIGNKWFVDTDAEQLETGNDLVDQVLRAG